MFDQRTMQLPIRLPIVQSPMAGVQDADLALAVSAAGGLGSIPAAMMSAGQLADNMARMQASGLAYNVNFFCHQPPKVKLDALEAWHKRLSPWLDKYDLASKNIPLEPSRQPFSAANADLLAQFKPPVVSFHFGLPAADLVARIKGWGGLVMSSATTLEEAEWLADKGADVVIAQGIEAGGHRGIFLTADLATQLPTMELLQACVANLEVPIIAAGGIGTQAQVQACLDAGAAAVQVGTTFLLCDEAATNAFHRRALQSEGANKTHLTNVFSGRPARSMENVAVTEIGPWSDVVPSFPLAGNAMGLLRKAAEAVGKDDFTPLWSGTNNRACDTIPAAQMVRRLAGVEDK